MCHVAINGRKMHGPIKSYLCEIPSRFEATAAKAKLDMLFDWFNETNFFDSTTITEKSNYTFSRMQVSSIQSVLVSGKHESEWPNLTKLRVRKLVLMILLKRIQIEGEKWFLKDKGLKVCNPNGTCALLMLIPLNELNWTLKELNSYNLERLRTKSVGKKKIRDQKWYCS